MPTDTAVVTRVVQSSVQNPNGTLAVTYNVSFTVGKHGPFLVQVPAAQFNAAHVQQLLAEFANTINALPQGGS
jgi:hypothetical protein